MIEGFAAASYRNLKLNLKKVQYKLLYFAILRTIVMTSSTV